MSKATLLLKEANNVLDFELLAKAAKACTFAKGAEWMRLVLEKISCKKIKSTHSAFVFCIAGYLKYGLASLGALILTATAYSLDTPFIIIFCIGILGFYLLESRFVFLFPCLIDSAENPISRSQELFFKAGGTINVILTVMQIAFHMLFAGFTGNGFIASWARGCAAIAIWYHELISKDTISEAKNSRKFDFWCYDRVDLREEIITTSLINDNSHINVLLISDLHFGSTSTSKILNILISQIKRSNPDIILFAGDLLENESGSDLLKSLFQSLPMGIPWAACPGNHDQRAGLEKLARLVKDQAGIWLPSQNLKISINGINIEVAGESANFSEQPSFKILCLHYPKDDLYNLTQANLIVAGHLHGSQFVLWKKDYLLYPGKYFYKWNGLRFDSTDKVLIMSKGIGDTLPFRWNCLSEIVLCKIQSI